MICPGSSGFTVGANPTVARIVNGFGVDATGKLCIDTDPVAGSLWVAGFRISATGALYGTTTTTGTKSVQGVRISDTGQVVYAAAAAQDYVNGNPIRTNGALATS